MWNGGSAMNEQNIWGRGGTYDYDLYCYSYCVVIAIRSITAYCFSLPVVNRNWIRAVAILVVLMTASAIQYLVFRIRTLAARRRGRRLYKLHPSPRPR